MNVSMVSALAVAVVCLARPHPPASAQSHRPFTFRPYFAATSSLNVASPRVTGALVRVDGSDSRCPQTPFTFDWGDGTRDERFFPADHTYRDTKRSYVVTVTAHYADGEDRQTTTVRFGRTVYSFARDRRVPRRMRIASEPVTLGTTMPGYDAPTDLCGFADADLAVPRSTLEYVLDVGHSLQADFCSGDIDTSGGTGQIVLNQPSFGGAFSLWFTKPVAMGANPAYLSDLNGISSLFHEMGHNLTLNSPARYRFGGRTDGPMSTIVSETLAQVMQHAAAWEILNAPGQYGLSRDLADAVRDSAINSFGVTAGAYHRYVANGCPFATRQMDGEKQDRTFGTFMALAYVFVEQAEDTGAFREPLKRMMRLLQTFSASDHARYQRPKEDAFRATFMVAAMSYGFDRDLRPRFRELKFAIDDGVYGEMMGRMRAGAHDREALGRR